LLAAPTAFAGQMPTGQIGGHVTMTAVFIEGTGFVFYDDGTGFGVRGWGMLQGPWYFHGEYQTVTIHSGPVDVDIDQLRLGGGWAQDMWIAKAEYIDTGSDLDQGGFGVHGGLHTQSGNVGFMGTVGYLMLDDADGIELNIGASLAFNRDWSGVVDYRTFLGSVDPMGDLTLTDLRIGVMYSFR
jgi:hypothetical protein